MGYLGGVSCYRFRFCNAECEECVLQGDAFGLVKDGRDVRPVFVECFFVICFESWCVAVAQRFFCEGQVCPPVVVVDGFRAGHTFYHEGVCMRDYFAFEVVRHNVFYQCFRCFPFACGN